MTLTLTASVAVRRRDPDGATRSTWSSGCSASSAPRRRALLEARERAPGGVRRGRAPDLPGRARARLPGRRRRRPTSSGAGSRSPGPAEPRMMINAFNSGANCFMVDLEDSLSPTFANVVRGQAALRDVVLHTLDAHDARGPRVPAERRRSRRCSSARAAGTWSRRTCWPTASPSRRASSTSRCSRSTARASRSSAASTPAFYLPKLENADEAALWNDVFVLRAGGARHPARHVPRDGPDRDDHRGVRDGRDPVRAARALRRPERRALGLHLQRHQEVPRGSRLRAARPRRRSR